MQGMGGRGDTLNVTDEEKKTNFLGSVPGVHIDDMNTKLELGLMMGF